MSWVSSRLCVGTKVLISIEIQTPCSPTRKGKHHTPRPLCKKTWCNEDMHAPSDSQACQGATGDKETLSQGSVQVIPPCSAPPSHSRQPAGWLWASGGAITTRKVFNCMEKSAWCDYKHNNALNVISGLPCWV